MINKFLFFLVVLISINTTLSAEITDLAIINIDNIGPKKVAGIKNNTKIDWWVEMGNKMVIATDLNTINNLPVSISIIDTQKNIAIENLAFQSLGHCDHSITEENLHHSLDVVFENNGLQLINTRTITDKFQLFRHDSIMPFAKNKVLAYQYNNREHKKVNKGAVDYQWLVDHVDQERWFTQVEYLSSLDRMLDADLIIAGEWLEDKFANLGLTVSRVDLNNRRGFNVLGFKQGITRPDDWYVVGAHLDSRNQNWNDGMPSPGAEDNASGCSGVLEVANIVSQYESEASIVFMCFNAEESGLLGSGDVITQLTADGDIDKVKTMLNMDMISYRLGSHNIAIAGTNNSLYQDLANTVAGYGNQYSDIDWQISTNMCCTDFVRFSNAGIPAVTSNQPDISTYFGYHSTQDLAENLDPVLGAGIVKANIATLAELAGISMNAVDLIYKDGFE